MNPHSAPSDRPSRILVTGCAGFIGSHVVAELLETGMTVIGVDNLSSGRMDNLQFARTNPRFSFALIDITHTDRFAAFVAKVQPGAIIHLAALVSVPEAEKNPDLNFLINIAATHHLAEIAHHNSIRRIVFASSAAVYGNPAAFPLYEEVVPQPISRYGAAKLASEHILFAAASAGGCPATCLRFFNVFGPRQVPSSPYSGVISIFVARAAAGEAITIFGDGTQTRDFVAVEDVAGACCAAALDPRTASLALNICTGKEITLTTIAAMLSEIRPGLPEPIFAPARNQDILRSCGCPDRARAELGFRPRDSVTALHDFLAETIPVRNDTTIIR
jgi:UDP-glucose 4-epimerase